jgi:hypothetical protein
VESNCRWSDFPASWRAMWARVRDHFTEAELRECEALIRITAPDAEFRAAIVDAAFWAGFFNAAPPRRAAIVRKEIARLAAHFEKAVTALEQLSLCAKEIAKEIPLPLTGDRAPGPWATLLDAGAIDCLRGFAGAARRGAECVPVDVDRGGPSERRIAFRVFVSVLATGFGRATGRPAAVSWNEYDLRYQGRFFDLVERLLPLVNSIVGEGFAAKNANARGKAIQRALARMDRTPAVPP